MCARKGGCGKTTIAVHLAAIAAERGLGVLVFDTDPQRSFTAWWRRRENRDPWLRHCSPTALARELAELRRNRCMTVAGQVDLVLVDTRASLEADTRIVAASADLALVPLRPALLDLDAVTHTASALNGVGAKGAFVLNMCRPRRGGLEADVIGEARRFLSPFGLPVLEPTVGHRVALEDSLSGGAAVTETAPDSIAAREMRALWNDVEKRLWPTGHGARSTRPSRSGRRPAGPARRSAAA